MAEEDDDPVEEGFIRRGGAGQQVLIDRVFVGFLYFLGQGTCCTTAKQAVVGRLAVGGCCVF